jgi:uncharacterized membrane protein YhfC
MIGTVPGASIFGMVLSFILAMAVPIVAAIYMKRKYDGKLICTMIGIAAFVVFALLLEQLLHVLGAVAFGDNLTRNPVLYAIYGGLAAALCEETGRFLSMKLLMKKTLFKENAVMYGIGHGGAEAIILIVVSFLPNLMTSIMINNGSLEEALSGLEPAAREQTINELSVLWESPSAEFYLAGIERVTAFLLQLCLSYIVYLAVRYKNTKCYFIAFVIHFIVDAGIIQLREFMSVYIVETIFLIFTLVLAYFTLKKYRSEVSEEVGQFLEQK